MASWMMRRGTSGGGSYEPWAPGHKCTKGKAHYIKVYLDSESEEETKLEAGQGEEGSQLLEGAPLPEGGGPFAPSWGMLASF